MPESQLHLFFLLHPVGIFAVSSLPQPLIPRRPKTQAFIGNQVS